MNAIRRILRIVLSMNGDAEKSLFTLVNLKTGTDYVAWIGASEANDLRCWRLFALPGPGLCGLARGEDAAGGTLGCTRQRGPIVAN